jgi:hypothetical protein
MRSHYSNKNKNAIKYSNLFWSDPGESIIDSLLELGGEVFFRTCIYFIKKKQSSQIHQSINKVRLRRNLAREQHNTTG